MQVRGWIIKLSFHWLQPGWLKPWESGTIVSACWSIPVCSEVCQTWSNLVLVVLFIWTWSEGAVGSVNPLSIYVIVLWSDEDPGTHWYHFIQRLVWRWGPSSVTQWYRNYRLPHTRQTGLHLLSNTELITAQPLTKFRLFNLIFSFLCLDSCL